MLRNCAQSKICSQPFWQSDTWVAGLTSLLDILCCCLLLLFLLVLLICPPNLSQTPMAEPIIVNCRAGDVPLSVEHIRYYAGWADKIHGSIVPTGGKFYAQVYREPLGEPLLFSCGYL